MTEDAQQQASACATHVFGKDRVASALGMELLEAAPGTATISLTVTEPMTNGHGSCHGGITFTLADTAFALACNSHNQVTVASGCDISFLAPVWPGDRLTARATERDRRHRSGIYDVTVSNQKGEQVALFRGRSHTVRNQTVLADNQDFKSREVS